MKHCKKHISEAFDFETVDKGKKRINIYKSLNVIKSLLIGRG